MLTSSSLIGSECSRVLGRCDEDEESLEEESNMAKTCAEAFFVDCGLKVPPISGRTKCHRYQGTEVIRVPEETGRIVLPTGSPSPALLAVPCLGCFCLAQVLRHSRRARQRTTTPAPGPSNPTSATAPDAPRVPKSPAPGTALPRGSEDSDL